MTPLTRTQLASSPVLERDRAAAQRASTAAQAAAKAGNAVDWRTCPHDYVTSHGRGWECCDCGVGLLSLVCPIPLPTVARALEAVGAMDETTNSTGDTQ